MAEKILSGFKLIGTLGGGYVGYKYGNKLKEKIYIKYPKIQSDYISPFFKDSVVTEKTTFNIGGGLLGMLVGCSFWFFSIPITLVVVSRDYPEIKNLIKDL